MNMVNTSTEDVIDKLQQLKGKTKLNFYKIINNYYNEMKHNNFQTQEDPYKKNAQGISKNYLEVLLFTSFLETKSEVKNMNINYYDFYYTVLKNRDEKEIVDNQYENDEKDIFSLNDVIIPNHYVGIRDREKRDLGRTISSNSYYINGDYIDQRKKLSRNRERRLARNLKWVKI